jgi:ABC-2 type transport system permease protein
VWVKRRSVSALVGVLVLALLVGLALVGYYQPAWRTLSLSNPISLGAIGLGRFGAAGATSLAPAVLALVGLTLVAVAVGSRGAKRMEA